jgi:hypothetical protein
VKNVAFFPANYEPVRDWWDFSGGFPGKMAFLETNKRETIPAGLRRPTDHRLLGGLRSVYAMLTLPVTR